MPAFSSPVACIRFANERRYAGRIAAMETNENMGNACAAAPSGAAACPLPQDAMRPNQKTRQVHVGNVALGGGAPVVVQSMLNAPADDAQANLAQIQQLADAGCEVVRMAIPRRSCLDTFQAVCEESPLPVVADVHFDATIAIEAAPIAAIYSLWNFIFVYSI